MPKNIVSTDIAKPLGPYSMGIVCQEPGRWLHIAGQVGIDFNNFIPADFSEQVTLAWSNFISVLQSASMTVEDLVKINVFLTDISDLEVFGSTRLEFLGRARPASTILIVKALANPRWRIEIDGVAFVPR